MADMKNLPAGEHVTIYHPGEYNLENLEAARIVGPNIVVIGGGTGLSTLLRGLKECTENITAVVTMADDGGGSGMLREDLGIPPPGDIRSCILALSNMEPVMEGVLNYRFTDGSLAGQSFGNLMLAALNGISDSFVEAVRRMSDVLAITGRVLPVTTENVFLRAELENGASVIGESKIPQFKKEQNSRIHRVSLLPERPKALPQVLGAIRDADMIVLGPGSLYTSVIPTLLVEGVAEAIAASGAFRVYVCNVMTQEGETEGYTASEHLNALFAHSVPGLVGTCLVNSAPVSPALVEKYRGEGAEPIRVDADRFPEGVEIVRWPLISEDTPFARHHPARLAAELLSLHALHHPRKGVYGRYDRLMARWNTDRGAAGDAD